ncbi:hypothetical protein ASG52_08370 [Methylobacterium sp. Leaf456]|uniref:hypothetical protein n=1 Tax=Methylobacterium sp. Leaf456 TaxID=1736382 RepID=UPI0006F2C63E|nr:hypothetical protein [Methylobacterium sp. Leaf456]KQT50072.1 hypothetical protein ASG52_08370 [Methylobacterium sp. Leaf456]
MPYQAARPGRHASVVDPTTWADYATAARAVAAGRANGIGFALHGSAFAAFDIDDCRDRETLEIADWALRLIERASSYAEVTVSGTGVRIIGRAAGAYVHRNQAVPDAQPGRIETYRSASRYIVVTGESLDDPPAELADLDPLIDETVAWLDAATRAAKQAEREAKWAADGHGAGSVGDAGFGGSGRGFAEGSGSGEALPRALDELVRLGPAAGGDRSAAFHHAVCWLKDLGWTVARIEALLGAHPRGVADKYAGRLRGEIERCYDKAEPPRSPGAGADGGRRREGRHGGRDERGAGATDREIPLHWHRDADPTADRAWLVNNTHRRGGQGAALGAVGHLQDLHRARPVRLAYGAAATYNASTHLCRFPGGATLQLDQYETAQDFAKYQGKSFTFISVDEAGQYSDPAMLDLLRSCLRAPLPIVPRFVMAANPGGPGHAWLCKRHVFRAAPWTPYLTEEPVRTFVNCPSTFGDNPNLDQGAYARQLDAATATDPELGKAWKHGDWPIARGAYFSTVLDVARVMIEPWAPGRLPAGWDAPFLAHDYGVSAPSVTYMVARSPGGRGPDGRF